MELPTLDFIVQKAHEIALPTDTSLVKARKVFQFVKTQIHYMADRIAGESVTEQLVNLLRDRRGNCEAQSFLFSALCRANPVPVPARIICGELINDRNIFFVHHWAEFYLEGLGWIPVDPTRRSPEPLYWFGYTDTGHFSLREVTQMPTGDYHLFFFKPEQLSIGKLTL